MRIPIMLANVNIPVGELIGLVLLFAVLILANRAITGKWSAMVMEIIQWLLVLLGLCLALHLMGIFPSGTGVNVRG